MCGKPESFAVDIDQTANIGSSIPHTRHTEVDNTGYFQYLSIDHNIEDAITLFRELGQQQFLAMALNNLGCTKVELNEYTAAVPLFREALHLVQPLGAQSEIASLLDSIASLPLHSGDTGRALRLLAASSALREAIGETLTFNTAAYTEPKLKAARLRLGEAGFKVFWEEGRAMTVEQAITLAEQALQLAIHTEVNSE